MEKKRAFFRFLFSPTARYSVLSLLVVGLLVGWLAFALGSLLMVDLSVGEATLRPVFGDSWSTSMFAANGAPLLPAFLAYFAGIFVVLRWWRRRKWRSEYVGCWRGRF